jgi:hypothetical protein
LGWHREPQRLEGFIERVTAGKRVAPGACSKAEASDCITALRDLTGE